MHGLIQRSSEAYNSKKRRASRAIDAPTLRVKSDILKAIMLPSAATRSSFNSRQRHMFSSQLVAMPFALGFPTAGIAPAILAWESRSGATVRLGALYSCVLDALFSVLHEPDSSLGRSVRPLQIHRPPTPFTGRPLHSERTLSLEGDLHDGENLPSPISLCKCLSHVRISTSTRARNPSQFPPGTAKKDDNERRSNRDRESFMTCKFQQRHETENRTA